MKQLKLIAMTLLTIVTINGFAATPGQMLQAQLAKIRTVKSNFSEVVKTRSGRVLQRSSGRMMILRPGRFRWESRKPTRQLIIADGRRLWVYDRDLKQVTVRSQKKGLGRTPAQFLSGYDKNLTRNYTVKFKRGYYQLTPRRRGASFNKIWMKFRRGKLTQLYLVDKLGQVSTITFSRMIMNRRLNPGLFRFRPPRGVDVLRQ